MSHEDLLVVERFLDSSTPHREVFTRPETQIDSSHDLDQRLWTSQLAAHIAELRPLSGDREQSPGTGGLLFYGREKKPLNRNYFNTYIWRPTLAELGMSSARENGMHALRHACASTWLEHGVSIKAVSEYLGHADPGFTLRVYTHVMPSSGQRARKAMDAAFEASRRPLEPAPIAGAHLAHESTTSGGK